MKIIAKGSLAATLACLCVLGLLASAHGQVIKAPQPSKDPRQGPVTLPQIKGGQFPTKPKEPVQPVYDYATVSSLARKLAREAGRLHDAVDDRFRDTREYRLLHKEAQAIELLAGRIEAAADRKFAPAGIQQLVNQVRVEARAADRLVGEMSRNRDISRRMTDELRDHLEQIDDLAGDIGRQLLPTRR